MTVTRSANRSGSNPGGPVLSVIVASVESRFTLDKALGALERTSADLAIEILVVDASHDESAQIAEAHSGVKVIRHSPNTLVPQLWGDGIRRSSGRFVALSTGHCIVGDAWANALVRALESGYAGAGSGLRLLPGVSALDRAVFYLRYGGFLDQTRGEPRPVSEVPGDNAAYQGGAIRDFMEDRAEGFWEVEYHKELARDGGRLLAVPEGVAGFGHSFPFWTIVRHRLDHGRYFGSWRCSEGGESKWRVVLPSPLVPAVLFVRAARRAFAHPGHRLSFSRAVLPFLALSTAWALGEAVGALAGPGPSPRAVP